MADSRLLVNRMVRAAKLDPTLYDEVAADTSATGQAFLVVSIASLPSVILLGVGAIINDKSATFAVAMSGAALGGSFVLWLLWSVVAYWSGKTVFKARERSASFSAILRTIGFANSPKVFFLFSIVPVLGIMVGLVAVPLWTFAAGVVAIQRSLAVSAGLAIALSVGVWLFSILVATGVVEAIR